MRCRWLCTSMVVVLACARQGRADTCGALAAGARATCTLEHGGRTREYRIVVPASIKQPAPLVLNLHGRKGVAWEQELRLVQEAEREGFILVSPQGYERSWNAGVGFGAAHDAQLDDVGFLRAVIADASRIVTVDRRRVYATGLSNGARMVHRLACEASDVIAAIASVAGPISDRNTESGERAFDCKPPRAVPVMMIHGKRDRCTPYDGGKGLDTHGNVATPLAAAEWSQRDACTTTTTQRLGSTTCEIHGGCADGAEVVLCSMETGGHVWPGGKDYPLWRACGGTWPEDFRASDQMWTFFVAHPMPDDTHAAVPWQPAPLAAPSPATHAALELSPVDSVDLPFDRSILRVGLRGTSPSTFDGMRTYQAGSLALGGALSLYSRMRVDGEGIHAFRLMTQFRLEGERVASELFAQDQQVTKAGLGIAATYLTPGLDMYALYAGAAIAESRDRLASPTLLPSVIGLGTYRASQRVTWIYGGGLGYALGRAWLLPAAGVMWTPSPSFSVTTILPILVQLRHRFSHDIAGDLIMTVSGDMFDFSNQSAFAGAAEHLRLRLGEARLAAGVSYRWNKHWSVRGELGAVGPRKLSVVDNDATVMSATSRGAGYLATSVSYAFGDAPF